jgi:hypothetical protein
MFRSTAEQLFCLIFAGVPAVLVMIYAIATWPVYSEGLSDYDNRNQLPGTLRTALLWLLSGVIFVLLLLATRFVWRLIV